MGSRGDVGGGGAFSVKIIAHSLAYPVTSLGPGRRVVLWVAGCSRRCPGCISPELLTSQAGHEVSLDALLERLCRIEGEIDGITLSGGDPVDQAEPVAALLRALRARRPLWNVMVYTGYTLAQMQQDPGGMGALLPCVDLLVDGPFLREVPPVHPLAGSGNQQLHALTPEGEVMRRNASSAAEPSFNLGFFATGETRLIGVSTAAERERTHRSLQLSSPCDDSIR